MTPVRSQKSVDDGANANSEGFDIILLDIFVNKNSLGVPLSVYLSQEQADSELKITNVKTIKFTVHETTSENKTLLTLDFYHMNDLDIIKSTCDERENSNKT